MARDFGSIFGGRRRMGGASLPENLGVNPLQPVAQKPDIPTGEVRSRRSFMGGPSTLAVIGATLRQMDGGNELDEYLSGQQDQQYQRDMFGLRAAQGKREDDETERTRQERLAALAALPPNLRPIAPLLTNEAISNAVLPPTPEWAPIPQAELPPGARFGQRNARTGQADLDWAPAQTSDPNGRGRAPSGYEWTPSGELRAIRGGPAAASSGVFPAEQRARTAIMYEPALEAARNIDRLFQGGYSLESDRGAAIASAVPFDGGAVSRMVGSQNYNQMVSASSTFESAMLPILSGAAVTPSEATRIIRSALPQIDDTPAVRADKARRRQQMLNGAARIGGQPLPFPDLGLPDWAANAERAVSGAGAAGVNGADEEPPERAAAVGISAEEWSVMPPEDRAFFE